MKNLILALSAFLWMTIVSLAGALFLLWLAPYCFVSSWLKVIAIAVFGTWIFKKVWNFSFPYVSLFPVAYFTSKFGANNSSYIAGAVPPVIICVSSLIYFWVALSDITFDAKDWITASIWNYVTISCFYHLSLGQLSLIGRAPQCAA